MIDTNQALLTNGEPVRSIAEYSLPRGKLIIALQGEPPAWVEPTLKTLEQLLTLPCDWDSYGGRPIDPACIWAAWQLLMAVLREDSPTPALVPTGRGGIQIEWHQHGMDLEIEVVSPHSFHVSFEETATGEVWDKEVTDDLSELVAWVSRLAHPRNESGQGGGAKE